ncbi:hypothetical protein PCE1_004075 [Barthelona sp. PCE]
MQEAIEGYFSHIKEVERPKCAVIGGCELYTGAPHFAAQTAALLGADVAVFCSKGSARSIRSYSLDYTIKPILGMDSIVETDTWQEELNGFTSVLIGCGLSRENSYFQSALNAIVACQNLKICCIVDADALYALDMLDSDIFVTNTILTPNHREFDMLIEKQKFPSCVTLLRKGRVDAAYNGEFDLIREFATEYRSPRRCGGQGDVLGGFLLAFSTYFTNDVVFLLEIAANYTRKAVCNAFRQNRRKLTGMKILEFIQTIV